MVPGIFFITWLLSTSLLMTSVSKKQLRVTFILAGTNSVFPGTNSNTLRLTGLRMATKTKSVARLASQCEMRIYGMKRAIMNALTVTWANPPVVLDHLVILESREGEHVDADSGWTQVFKGTIVEAQPEYRSAPEVYFGVVAVTGYFQKIRVDGATPTSYPEAMAADIVIHNLIDRMGFRAEINGDVGAVVLTNPYFSGSLFDQFVSACQSAGADFYILGDVILVTMSGQPRDAQPAVALNSGSGLIGYPVYERSGLNVDAIYNPAFLCGTAIELTSSVPSATGRWFPYAMVHLLDVEMPAGQWRTEMQCLRVLVN